MITIVISTLVVWSRRLLLAVVSGRGGICAHKKHVPGSFATFGKFGTPGYFTPFTLGSIWDHSKGCEGPGKFIL